MTTLMNDLFKNSNLIKDDPKESYGAKDIEVLEGLEPVRKRPGMYIGGTDQKSLHHLIHEILDNSMDEVVANHATQITITLEEGNIISIADNGRGIPIDPHPKFPNKSALEVIMTTLHAGGKFSSNSYETAGGLHGVGLSVVNALSDHLVVDVFRQSMHYQQTYSKGFATSSLQVLGKAPKRGTVITFHPDAEIFGPDFSFDPTLILPVLKAKAYLFKGTKIVWKCAKSIAAHHQIPESMILHFPGGLIDFLNQLNEEETVIPNALFSGTAPFTTPMGNGRVEWAVTWLAEGEGQTFSYCNTIPTPLGGTHENAIKQAMNRAFRVFIEKTIGKKGASITSDDIWSGAVVILSCFLPQPQFQGQTKEKLSSPEATRILEPLLKDHFDHWLGRNPGEAQAVLESVLQRMEERLRSKQNKETARQSATKRLRLPGKLSDCTSTDPKVCEIFLVEGDSAGGSAKQARDRRTQAILPLRGKILNVASASLDKLKANQELRDLSTALGCSMGKQCHVGDLRYDKVIIMTDADVDGAHIASLLLTFFVKEMKPLVEKGHIYLAQPPLYRLQSKNKTVYATNDKDKDRLLKTVFKNMTNVDISRFKGLGEMLPQQLRETTMDVTKRFLWKVVLSDEKEVLDFVDDLMGRQSEFRYQFICQSSPNLIDLDV